MEEIWFFDSLILSMVIAKVYDKKYSLKVTKKISLLHEGVNRNVTDKGAALQRCS